MKELPFLEIKRYDEKEHKKYQDRMKKLKKEKNLKGDDILEILLKKIKKVGFLTVTEKNYRAENNAPFDLTIGDEDNLQMIGFEIKGDTDNFSRLKDQLSHYIFAFDGVYLVLHKKQKPEWLPNFLGVIRVFEDGEIYMEEYSSMWDFLDVGSHYDWDALFRSNHLGITSKKTREVLNCIKHIRKNILFNRFFAIQEGWNTHKFKKFYPFTEEQKAIMIGFDVPYHYKLLKRDITDCEKRLQNINEIISLGQQSLDKSLFSKRKKNK